MAFVTYVVWDLLICERSLAAPVSFIGRSYICNHNSCVCNIENIPDYFTEKTKVSWFATTFTFNWVFTVMALLPTIGVAIFATFTVNMGLEAWFSDRVQSVIGASRSAAEAYETEQRSNGRRHYRFS